MWIQVSYSKFRLRKTDDVINVNSSQLQELKSLLSHIFPIFLKNINEPYSKTI